MKELLALYGISSQIGEDTFTVFGGEPVASGVVDSCGDHRIAMAAAIMSTVSKGVTAIDGASCVAKSYPTFFDDFSMLGGCVE
jgi:3-phosphoshikimate 1-carboxyvinyltransferase